MLCFEVATQGLSFPCAYSQTVNPEVPSRARMTCLGRYALVYLGRVSLAIGALQCCQSFSCCSGAGFSGSLAAWISPGARDGSSYILWGTLRGLHHGRQVAAPCLRLSFVSGSTFSRLLACHHQPVKFALMIRSMTPVPRNLERLG